MHPDPFRSPRPTGQHSVNSAQRQVIRASDTPTPRAIGSLGGRLPFSRAPAECGPGPVCDEQRQWEEEQAEDEVPEKAVPLRAATRAGQKARATQMQTNATPSTPHPNVETATTSTMAWTSIRGVPCSAGLRHRARAYTSQRGGGAHARQGCLEAVRRAAAAPHVAGFRGRQRLRRCPAPDTAANHNVIVLATDKGVTSAPGRHAPREC